jgi:glycosyltransferase involved in cell wall biosynthesis
MKILIAAAACHPTSGSEAYVGWQAVAQLRKNHELWVMTSGWCREGIEAFLRDHPEWNNVRFHYVDEALPDHPNRLVARIFSWIRYRRWCHKAAVAGGILAAEVDFDIAHHVTMATWRTGSPLAGLGIPWIWGPIGGGEVFPWKLLSVLSFTSILFELVRGVSTLVAQCSQAVRTATKTATLVLPNNPETERTVMKMGVPEDRVHRLCQSFLPEGRLECLKRSAWMSPKESGELRCLAGGNLEGRKGVAIALRALSILSLRGIPFRYTYLGRGPELDHLKRLALRLRIHDKVEFLDSLSGEEYAEVLRSHHVYLLPSLREGVPVTQMEAMAGGCVPVVADCGGAGPMALAGGSRPVMATSSESTAVSIAERLMRIWEDPDGWSVLSKSARKAIEEGYSAENYRLQMEGLYGRCLTIKKTRKIPGK